VWDGSSKKIKGGTLKEGMTTARVGPREATA
jgi:hypothetical protein